MPTWRPDATFSPFPRTAMQAPAETLVYVVRVNPSGDDRPDAIAIAVADVDPTSSSDGQLIGEAAMTHPGDELHHLNPHPLPPLPVRRERGRPRVSLARWNLVR